MPKPVLPTYSLKNLNGSHPSPKDFIADRFANYLEEHKDLHFPHKHSFYHLVYFSSGSGTHSIDFIHFPVEAGLIYFMIPGQVHSWDFHTTPDGYIVNFSEQYLNGILADTSYLDKFNFLSGAAVEQVIAIPKQRREQVEEILETIVVEGKSDELLHEDFARTALVQLLILVNRYSPTVFLLPIIYDP